MSKKLDDVSWHDDGQAPHGQAAAHIAFYFCWLINRGLITNESLNEWGAGRPLNTNRPPSEYLEEFSDDKLFIEDMVEEAAKFSIEYYEAGKYYSDYADLKLEKDTESANGYEIIDTWGNAEIVAKMLDEKFSEFTPR